MTDTSPPRTAVQLFAQTMGVSERYAEQYISRAGGPSPTFKATDAELRVLASLADLEAARAISETDLSAVATDDDPEAELHRQVQEASNEALARSHQARHAVHTRWAKETPTAESTRPAREKFEQRFYAQVDAAAEEQGEILSPAERERRVSHARKAYFADLARKSVEARRKSK